MKKILLPVAMLFAFVANTLAADGYKITGHVSDIPDGTTLYLRLVGPPSKDIDSVKISNGNFSFKGRHDSAPQWALIALKGQFLSVCDFYLENGNIAINGTRYSSRATGTETNRQYNFYNDSINSMFSKAYSKNVEVSMATDSASRIRLKAELKQIQDDLLDREVAFVKQYPQSVISLRIVDYICRDASGDDILRYVSCLSPQLQATETATSLKAYAARQKQTAPGTAAPAFTLKTDKGKSVSLADYRGKYLLIDFWASWCGPCRASFPEVKSLYEKYQVKNFDILGLSLDKKEDAWRKALKEEDCPWTQVVDLDGAVAHKYAVTTIPLMVLVNPDGTINGKFNKSTIADKLESLFK